MATSNITISSFQGGLSNDRNIGQEGAFWNSKNINYRENSSYIELAKTYSTVFTKDIAFFNTPTAITFWGDESSITTDIIYFTNDGRVVNSTGSTYKVATGSIVNVAEANGNKYLIGGDRLHEFIDKSTVTENIAVFTKSNNIRPAINFYGDIIIGDGTSLIRYNKDGSFYEEATVGDSNPILKGLDGNVTAITQVGANVYIWCNNGSNTVQYIWDGVSSRPTQKLVYADLPVRNVALIGNTHYWWTRKSDYSIRTINIGESYAPQTFIKSGYPKNTLDAEYDNEKNRMALQDDANFYTNAIETNGGIVYLPAIGSLFSFGKYYPGDKYSLSRDISYTGTLCYAMVSGGITGSGRDAGGMLAFAVKNGADIDINVVNFGQLGEATLPPIYASSGFIETMEYLAPDYAEGENSQKITFPFELPHSSTSIKVYVKYDRGSYTLIKTLDTTTYGSTGYFFAEISDTGKWKSKQIKFELITTEPAYTPKLYTQIINKQQEVGKR